MKPSLKSSTVWRLGSFLIANTAAFAIVALGAAGGTPSLLQAVSGGKGPAWLGVALLITTVLNGLLSAGTKARLVFLRWRNPLPGSEAFTRYAKEDPRVDMQALKRRLGALPRRPRDQNALWYRLYKQAESDIAVMQAHRDYLLTRDMTALAFAIAVALGALSFLSVRPLPIAAAYTGALFLQFWIIRVAAANYGRRFVCTVLAVSSTL